MLTFRGPSGRPSHGGAHSPAPPPPRRQRGMPGRSVAIAGSVQPQPS